VLLWKCASHHNEYGPHAPPLRGSLPPEGANFPWGGPAGNCLHPFVGQGFVMKHIARKRFGQHFLSDGGIIDAIVHEIAPKPGQRMVEIGPGLAALTQPLVERLGHLTVIELDRDLAQRLRSHGQLTVIESDVLKVDFGSIQTAQAAMKDIAPEAPALHSMDKLRVVGNLPYNISTPILFHLLQYVDAIEDQHFMLQKEVIDRMVAQPATSDYSRLSVMLQWRYAMENVLFVPPESFDPPPRVDSAVVRMLPLAQPPAIDIPLFSEMVQVAFSQRRKLLRHTLGRWLEARGFGGTFDVQRRAEEVPVQEYVSLVQQL
jgi:16S rRNA (adenine1518-N6/adenine1519-N6)-dimethyltransferase